VGRGKNTLEEKGISFDFFYITDLQGNPTGGLQQSRAGWQEYAGTIGINFDKTTIPSRTSMRCWAGRHWARKKRLR